jgi:hypothetical protein
MRVIDAEKLFVTLTHLALRGKKILGCGFIRNCFVGRDVPEGIDVFCRAIPGPAYQTTTLFG